MAISVFDLFKIGIGPSSSHTVGPMRAALEFVAGLRDNGLLEQTRAVKAELYGSLGATGKGHGSDKAVLLGLEGEDPETVDTEAVEGRLTQIRATGRLKLQGIHEISFVEKEHLIMYRRKSLPYHPNGNAFSSLTTAPDKNCAAAFIIRWAAASWSTRRRPAPTIPSRRTTPHCLTPLKPVPNCWAYAPRISCRSANSCWKTKRSGARSRTSAKGF